MTVMFTGRLCSLMMHYSAPQQRRDKQGGNDTPYYYSTVHISIRFGKYTDNTRQWVVVYLSA